MREVPLAPKQPPTPKELGSSTPKEEQQPDALGHASASPAPQVSEVATSSIHAITMVGYLVNQVECFMA